jgi:hypothetical protein
LTRTRRVWPSSAPSGTICSIRPPVRSPVQALMSDRAPSASARKWRASGSRKAFAELLRVVRVQDAVDFGSGPAARPDPGHRQGHHHGVRRTDEVAGRPRQVPVQVRAERAHHPGCDRRRGGVADRAANPRPRFFVHPDNGRSGRRRWSPAAAAQQAGARGRTGQGKRPYDLTTCPHDLRTPDRRSRFHGPPAGRGPSRLSGSGRVQRAEYDVARRPSDFGGVAVSPPPTASGYHRHPPGTRG